MKLTKNSMKRKVKSTINPFYGKSGIGNKAGREAIKAGSGCISGFFQLSWWLVYWMFVGMWFFMKWTGILTFRFFKLLFYIIPKLIIDKYKLLTPDKKELTKVILTGFFTIVLTFSTISLLLGKEFGSFVVGIIITIGLGVWCYFSAKKYLELKQNVGIEGKSEDNLVESSIADNSETE